MIILDPFEPPEQQYVYDYTIELDGVIYRVVLIWKTRPEGWYLHLYDSDENALLLGKRLATDTPLLERYQIDGLPPGEIACLDSEETDQEPTFESLGRKHLIYYFDESEIPPPTAAEGLLIEFV
jgi:hypothetical protein